MTDTLRAHETVSSHHVRAWTGDAVDEGVGLISMVEVSDERGRPLCRFEEFLDASLRGRDGWSLDDAEACRELQARAIERARAAVLADSLHLLHGHRFDVPLR